MKYDTLVKEPLQQIIKEVGWLGRCKRVLQCICSATPCLRITYLPTQYGPLKTHYGPLLCQNALVNRAGCARVSPAPMISICQRSAQARALVSTSCTNQQLRCSHCHLKLLFITR